MYFFEQRLLYERGEPEGTRRNDEQKRRIINRQLHSKNKNTYKKEILKRMPEGEPDNQSKQFTPVQPETSGKGNPMNLCGQTDKNGKHRKKYIYAGMILSGFCQHT